MQPIKKSLSIAFITTFLLPLYALNSETKLDQNTPHQDRYLHRINYSIGLGFATGLQNLITDAGNAWLINSAINSESRSQPAVLPLDKGEPSKYFPTRTILSYSYADRFDVSYRRSTVAKKFNRDESPAVRFLYPGGADYATSLFEGVRLMQFRYDHRLFEFGYFHRLTDKFKIGPVIAKHTYIEDLLVSYGSYTLRSSGATVDPSLLTWAQGGDARLKYEMEGLAYGLGLKWNVWRSVRLYYNLYLYSRSGNVAGGGFQLIQERNGSGGESGRIEGMYQTGSLTDKGMRHRLEAEWNYGRWNVAAGFERDSWVRTHSMFMTATNQSRDVASHGSLLGLGEMSTSSKGYRNELYLRVGVSAYFGDTKISKAEVTSEQKDQPAKPEEQPTQQITKDSSDYLNQMYSKIKDDYEQQILNQTENSFHALGIEVKKEVNSEGLTVNLQATIDGDIAFKTGSAELTAKAFEVVDKFGDALNQNPKTVARVHGHTDTPGSKQGNRILSQRRAESVQKALVSRKGIAPARIIEVKGFADDRRIIETNASEPKNRRTVILIEYGE